MRTLKAVLDLALMLGSITAGVYIVVRLFHVDAPLGFAVWTMITTEVARRMLRL